MDAVSCTCKKLAWVTDVAACSFDHVIILIRYASLASWQSWHVSDAVTWLPFWMSLETGKSRQSKSSKPVNLDITREKGQRMGEKKRATFPTPIRPRGLQKSVFQYGIPSWVPAEWRGASTRLTSHACSEALELSLTFEQDSED